ncbi:MAG: cobyrinic acid a,c-diamide synthase, partial [Candidatus Eremiobacteraeota bacterium]|nr:cobyrinic acid a,c-diamide synthase [Candidatus Eremiobacteraeota bacterium]
MRIAFIGKGGNGKSTIAGTVARLLGRAGDNVLALDVDTLPGLSVSLGLQNAPDST